VKLLYQDLPDRGKVTGFYRSAAERVHTTGKYGRARKRLICYLSSFIITSPVLVSTREPVLVQGGPAKQAPDTRRVGGGVRMA
jgi:hypothetical protein